MYRKADELIPLEVKVLRVASKLADEHEPWFHGYRMARLLHEWGELEKLAGNGTIYKALQRLESWKLLKSRRESPPPGQVQALERPRTYYRITPDGAAELRLELQRQEATAALEKLRATRKSRVPRSVRSNGPLPAG